MLFLVPDIVPCRTTPHDISNKTKLTRSYKYLIHLGKIRDPLVSQIRARLQPELVTVELKLIKYNYLHIMNIINNPFNKPPRQFKTEKLQIITDVFWYN